MLEPLAKDVWTTTAPLRFLGLAVGTRMTVIKLSSGGLFVHSPIALTPELERELDAIGEVACVVAPNRFHHLYVGDFQSAYPKAKIIGAPGLDKKRKDVRFDAILGDDPRLEYAADLEQAPVRGTMLHETVFYHRASKTLVSSDFVENFDRGSDWITDTYLKIGGIRGKPGLSWFFYPLFRDKKKALASVERVLRWDFERIALAHGAVIERDAHDIVERTYRFLK